MEPIIGCSLRRIWLKMRLNITRASIVTSRRVAWSVLATRQPNLKPQSAWRATGIKTRFQNRFNSDFKGYFPVTAGPPLTWQPFCLTVCLFHPPHPTPSPPLPPLSVAFFLVNFLPSDAARFTECSRIVDSLLALRHRCRGLSFHGNLLHPLYVFIPAFWDPTG